MSCVTSIVRHTVCSAAPWCVQMARAMERSRRNSRPLQHAAARWALWCLNDLPALVELALFPKTVRTPVCSPFLQIEERHATHGPDAPAAKGLRR